MRVFATPQGVTRVSLQKSQSFSLEIEGDSSHSEAIQRWFNGYLKGEEAPLPPLALQPLSPFEERVRSALLKTKSGDLMTYGELAETIGYKDAHRAVGNALSKNPLLLLIPCHRIVPKGKGGGFVSGTKIKEQLLAFEVRAATEA